MFHFVLHLACLHKKLITFHPTSNVVLWLRVIPNCFGKEMGVHMVHFSRRCVWLNTKENQQFKHFD